MKPKSSGEVFNVTYKEQPFEGGGLSVEKRESISRAFAYDDNGDVFWTSIPEGKLQHAKELGKLIELYLLSPKQNTLF